jgi:thiol-disulfide isomerase/thioredoxin
MSSLPVIYDVENMEVFKNLIRTNPGVTIFRFRADWCQPCKRADPIVNNYISQLGLKIQFVMVDVDTSFELYAYLKNKRQIMGIPAMLAYHRENDTYIPNDIVTGPDEDSINKFFNRCMSKAYGNTR